MMFWLAVAIAYALILALGVSIGAFLALKFPGDDGPWFVPDEWKPTPTGDRSRV